MSSTLLITAITFLCLPDVTAAKATVEVVSPLVKIRPDEPVPKSSVISAIAAAQNE